jgi:hypothetical protein
MPLDVDIGYVWERLYSAVLSLAAGTGGIRDRLFYALFLNLDRLSPEEFPEELTDEAQALFAAMTRVKDPGGLDEQTYKLSLDAMTDDEAVGHAEKLVGMLDEVVKLEAFGKYLEDQRRRMKPGLN